MLKRLFLAAAMTGLIAGVSVSMTTDSALAGKSGCRDAAKTKFQGDLKSRHTYKKECKAAWKAMAGKRGGPFKKAA